jgi:hypothetical protein
MTEDLQYRLYNHSITPPDGAWPAIATELDKESQERLAHKLQAAALEPPPAVWENIAGALYGAEVTDTPGQAKVVPIKRRWTRLAVAAMAIGIIVLAGLSYFMLNQSNEQAGVRPEPPAPRATDNIPQAEDNVATDPVVVYNNAVTSNFLPIASKRRRVIADNRVRYAEVETMDLSALEARLSGDVLHEQPVKTQPGTRIPPAQYLTVAAPNGQPARVSAKLTDGLSYVLNNEPTTSMELALRSIAWKLRFSNWSNKLLQSTGFIPTASNFMDIVELEELLKEQ